MWKKSPGDMQREVEHSDENLNTLEDWLFEKYAPKGCINTDGCDIL